MFSRLAAMGVPEKFLKATASFYHCNMAKLRIGVLLTKAFLVNAGVAEGRILSPFLFSLVFSLIWEKIVTAELPDGTRIYGFDAVWFVAFADDLAVLSGSIDALNQALSVLYETLAKYELFLSEIKSLGMIFHTNGRISRVGTVGNSPFLLNNVSLVLSDSFKYLGVWVTPDLKHTSHITNIEQRAEIAGIETGSIIKKLGVRPFAKIRQFFVSFVESQFSSLEVCSFNVCDPMLSIRRKFFARLFDLPRDFSSSLVNVFLSLEPPSIRLLRARFSLAKRLAKHPVLEVSSSLLLERILLKKRVGWLYEAYFLCKKINPALSIVNFDFGDFCANLLEGFPDTTVLSLELVQEQARINLGNGCDTLGFFLLFSDAAHFLDFRDALEKLSVPQMRVVLLFVSSTLRWRLCRASLPVCPICGRVNLVWSHFFDCSSIVEVLSVNFLYLDGLIAAVRDCRWASAFSHIGAVLLVWADVLSTFSLDLDVVKELSLL
jgi:hypothetical protein